MCAITDYLANNRFEMDAPTRRLRRLVGASLKLNVRLQNALLSLEFIRLNIETIIESRSDFYHS